MDNKLRDVTSHCRIRIDKDGKWYYENKEIINPLVIKSFCEALERDEYGRYRIVMGSEVCHIEVEDTPFVVSAVRGDPQCGLYIRLNTLETYPLDPDQLCIGENNVLYVMLPDGMKVRFNRPAYYSLALMMEEDDGGNIILNICGKNHQICPKIED
jgi:hypothetical protein